MDEQQPDTIAPSAKPLVPREVLQRVAAMKPAGAERLLLQHFAPELVAELLNGWEGLLPPRGPLHGALVSAAMTEHFAAEKAKRAEQQRRYERRRSR